MIAVRNFFIGFFSITNYLLVKLNVKVISPPSMSGWVADGVIFLNTVPAPRVFPALSATVYSPAGLLFI